jgi:hypothetical protein
VTTRDRDASGLRHRRTWAIPISACDSSGRHRRAGLPDRERPGDQIVEYAGEKVLLVDDRLSEALTGTLIDCTRVGMETELVIGRVEGAEPPAENNGAAR